MFILLTGFFLAVVLLVCLIPPALFTIGCRWSKGGGDFPAYEYFKTGFYIILTNYVVELLIVLINALFSGVGLENTALVLYGDGILFLLWIWIVLKVIKKRMGLNFGRSFLVFLWFLICVVISIYPIKGITGFFISPYSVPSAAMEDTLEVGDYFLTNKIYYGHSFFNKTARIFQTHQPARGEVIVFLYPRDHKLFYVKRCVGIPGDVVEMKNKELYLNGRKQDEPYVKHIDPQVLPRGNYFGWDRDNFGPVTVEAGHYFMLGDNRDNSADSRVWGTLDEKLILGKAVGIYWRGKDHRIFLKSLI